MHITAALSTESFVLLSIKNILNKSFLITFNLQTYISHINVLFEICMSKITISNPMCEDYGENWILDRDVFLIFFCIYFSTFVLNSNLIFDLIIF